MLEALLITFCVFMVVGLVALAVAVLAAVLSLAALGQDCDEQEDR